MLKEINNNKLARSKWKNQFFTFDVWKNIILVKQNYLKKVSKKNKFFRSSSIPNCFTSLRMNVYKGNTFKKIFVTKQLVGYKFGEFSFSRKPFFYPKKDIKKKR